MNAAKWWTWAGKGWSLLPGDEASYCQHQLQTVRLLFQYIQRWLRTCSLLVCLESVCMPLCRDSVQRGWRLLYILTAFHRCSDVIKPFLLTFLQDACASPTMQYQGIQSANNSTQHMALFMSDAVGLSADWLLLLIDRYRQGMWAESKEDVPVWRTHTVSQQHGTQSYAC